MAKLTVTKAKKIVAHGKIRGKSLTKKQKRLFHARAGGAKLRKKR